MFCHAVRFVIKDLKDLEKGPTRFSIDMQVLKDLKRIVTMELAGDRPPRYGRRKSPSFIVGPRAPGTLRPGSLSY